MNRRITRRNFLQTAVAGSVGAGIAWHFGGTLALGQIPVDQKEEMPLIGEVEGLSISRQNQLGDGIKNESPRLAIDDNERVWAAWIGEREDGEQLYIVSFDGENFGQETRVSNSNGLLLHPTLLAVQNGLALAWTEKQAHGKWDLKVRLGTVNNGGLALGEIHTLADAGLAWRPVLIADAQNNIWLVSEEKQGDGNFQIAARSISQNGAIGQRISISPEGAGDCMRPAAASDSAGNIWITWDQADGINGPHVYLAKMNGNAVDEPIRVSDHPASNIASAVCADADDCLWIAWHSNRRGNNKWDIPRWYYLRAFKDGTLYEPTSEPAGKDLTKQGTDQSFEFPRIYPAPGGGVLVTGRPSHNFCLQFYQGNGFSALYRLPVDSWGGRGQYLAAAFNSSGELFVARRDWGANVLQKITGFEYNQAKPELRAVKMGTVSAPAIVNADKKAVWEPLEELEGIAEPLNTYYGDIHGHTWMSDGMGDVDEYYHIRRDYYADDFASLTDHDTFVRDSILPSEFELMKELTEHFHEDGRFVTLFGQEYTTARYPRGIGHKCIYSTNMDIPLFDHMDREADTSQKLNQLCREWDALIAPHHVGWTGTDWENADERVQRLVEIVSNHGVFEYPGNQPIPHRGGMKGHFVQDALARGLKFGIIGGSDNHGLIWHHGMAFKRDSYRTGLACVLASELTREAIFDAMMKRRVFGTSGIKARLDFRVNNHLMGEEIELAERNATISVDVAAPEKIKWITIIKDNEDWHRYGGEGWRSFFSVKDEDITPGEHFYYMRVEFKNGDMAWSSPVWVTAA